MLRVREHHIAFTSSSCRDLLYFTCFLFVLVLVPWQGQGMKTRMVEAHLHLVPRVVNEKVGVLEGGPISTNSKLVGMETSIGHVDKSLAALLRCFDDLHARTNNQHRGGVQEGEHIAENSGADYFADTEVEDQDHHYAITVRVWVTPPHEAGVLGHPPRRDKLYIKTLTRKNGVAPRNA
ncbi:hypothetical protein PVAP13_4NG195800 [Panicum virgatum]|uniref:Uncharacterized protein n=1 Tax=Panicum virgatum TaxID=38727 RepID=A0A8T0T598_PANVG|nr:hypothetical protein PVAP13_4NG195800 [Panicum virgatum]